MAISLVADGRLVYAIFVGHQPRPMPPLGYYTRPGGLIMLIGAL